MAATAPWTWPPTRYHAGPVECPHKQAVANILALTWKTTHRGWTRWFVVDCPLLLAGNVPCDMSCLAQLPEPDTDAVPQRA